MARWESLRICDVITKINDEQMVLPVIQRRLVWNEGKMILLFDSLLKGILLAQLYAWMKKNKVSLYLRIENLLVMVIQRKQ